MRAEGGAGGGASAQNFDKQELEKAVYYCHARGVKVYLALNTLLTDDEMDDAAETVKEACSLPVDAVIVQDIGLASFIRSGEEQACASRQFYAKSTQMQFGDAMPAQITEGDRLIVAKAGGTEYTFDKVSGEIVAVKVGEQKLGGIGLNVWRAPTDNDMYEKKGWNACFLRYARPNVTDIHIEASVIRFSIHVGYACFAPLIAAELSYTFTDRGLKTDIAYRVCDEEHISYLPRIGLKMTLGGSFDRLSYLAYGPNETYCDLYEFARKDEYCSLVSQQYHPYVMPQESGSHFGVDYVELTDGETVIRAEGMQSFSALQYSAEMLNEVEEVSSASSFVKKITGIDNVCERAAVTYCKKHCEYFELIAGKSIETAMTAAIARRNI